MSGLTSAATGNGGRDLNYELRSSGSRRVDLVVWIISAAPLGAADGVNARRSSDLAGCRGAGEVARHFSGTRGVAGSANAGRRRPDVNRSGERGAGSGERGAGSGER